MHETILQAKLLLTYRIHDRTGRVPDIPAFFLEQDRRRLSDWSSVTSVAIVTSALRSSPSRRSPMTCFHGRGQPIKARHCCRSSLTVALQPFCSAFCTSPRPPPDPLQPWLRRSGTSPRPRKSTSGPQQPLALVAAASSTPALFYVDSILHPLPLPWPIPACLRFR